jgi:hypothetical protein
MIAGGGSDLLVSICFVVIEPEAPILIVRCRRNLTVTSLRP